MLTGSTISVIGIGIFIGGVYWYGQTDADGPPAIAIFSGLGVGGIGLSILTTGIVIKTIVWARNRKLNLNINGNGISLIIEF